MEVLTTSQPYFLSMIWFLFTLAASLEDTAINRRILVRRRTGITCLMVFVLYVFSVLLTWSSINLNKLLTIRHLLSIIDRHEEGTLINQFRNCPTQQHPSTEISQASALPTTKHATTGRWAFWPEDLAQVKSGYFVADWRGLSWKQRGDQDWPRPPRPQCHNESKRNGDEGK